jgi:hypothetical protein
MDRARVRYAVIKSSHLDFLNFEALYEDNPNTCRRSVDGTKALVSYVVNEYPIVESKTVESVTTIIEEAEVTVESKKEVFGRKRQDNNQSLTDIQAKIPFSTQVLAQAYSGKSKMEIKAFVRAGITNGDLTLPEAKTIQEAIVNYEFKTVDPNLVSITDEFKDIIEVGQEGKIIYQEGNGPSHSKIRSPNKEIVYQSKIDQYGNLSKIDKITYDVVYKGNVDDSLDTSIDVYDDEGNISEVRIISNGTIIGSRFPEEYTREEIWELLATPEWTETI